MSETPEDLYFRQTPPSSVATSMFIVQSVATSAAAAALDWTAGLTTKPQGRVHLKLEAVTTDVFVRFGPTSTTGTTANNGLLIKAGNPAVSFYASPTSNKFIDFVAPAGAGVLKIQVASPFAEREYI